MTESNEPNPTPANPSPPPMPGAPRDPAQPSVEPSTSSGPPAADPAGPSARPPTDWREPPWFPPRDQDRHEHRERRPNSASIVFGLIVLVIGIYYFFDRTLGIAMPAIRWGALWPVILVILGGLILFRSVERR